MTEILAIDLLGVIPDDESVVIATNQGEPVVGEESPAGKGYENICRRLTGEEIPVTDFSRHRNQKKTFGFISSQVGRNHMSVPSVAIAKDRLKNLLMSDRIQCTQDMTERLSKDLYQVIAKYMELDPEKVTIEITRNDIHIKYTGENH